MITNYFRRLAFILWFDTKLQENDEVLKDDENSAEIIDTFFTDAFSDLNIR